MDNAAEHRRQMRGVMALIRAIVRRTSTSATSVTDFVAHLNGRLDAVARVQEILMRDPSYVVDVLELVSDEFLLQGISAASVEISGPSVLLDRSVAATLALALHELTTNAIKFGQLNLPHRRVRVTCSASAAKPGWFVLTWREAALESQAVAAAESGFGFELIRRTLPYEIGAETEIALTADGLRCDIAFCPQRDAC